MKLQLITFNSICTWDDKKCHQVWYADRVMRVWGHAQRVCTDKGSGTQQSTKRGDQWVRGQAGFETTLPINKLVGCGGLCNELKYKDPKPANEGRHPYIKN